MTTSVRRATEPATAAHRQTPLCCRKDLSLAALRTPVLPAPPISPRVSFAKIREPLEVPNLLALQTASFDTLLGNERWSEVTQIFR